MGARRGRGEQDGGPGERGARAGEQGEGPGEREEGRTNVLARVDRAVKAESRRERLPAEEMLATVRTFEVVNADALALAAEALAEVKGHWRRLEERKKAVTGPLNAALREVRGWFAPAQDAYAEAERVLKEKIAGYHVARAELNRQALVEAAAAHAQGDLGGVQAALATVAVPERVDGLRVGEVWDFVVEDAARVPRAYCIVDRAKIQQALREVVEKTGGPPEIPGVRFFRQARIASRAV